MKTILVLMDSLNRHMLSIYNKDAWVKTPNIERLAEKSIIFDNHWLGSAPCMPARRDIFTGRLNFLERNWGPIEPYDITLQECLRKANVFTHISTDHTHYVEIGGAGYIQLFNTWDIQRGQEYDPWVSRVNKPALPDEYYGKVSCQYELNRSSYKNAEDYPSPRTFESAIGWLQSNKHADNYFLMIEAFDPHEPFDCPREYLDMYNDDYCGPRFDWSGYSRVTEPEDAISHLKKRYAATLTMNDIWLGKLLDLMDRNNLWEDTMLIFTTDHGHLLGEHGWTGKNIMHAYNELAHLPMTIHLPNGRNAGKRVKGLTQNIDIMPTVLDYFGAEIPSSVKGLSLNCILDGREDKVRDAAIYGWHGKAVNVTNGEYTYFRAPKDETNEPCYIYCSMPTTLWRYMGRDVADSIEMGRFLKHTNFPVCKMPLNLINHSSGYEYIKDTLLFDIKSDYEQQNPLKNHDVEKEMIKMMIDCMQKADSPDEQYVRLGIEI